MRRSTLLLSVAAGATLWGLAIRAIAMPGPQMTTAEAECAALTNRAAYLETFVASAELYADAPVGPQIAVIRAAAGEAAEVMAVAAARWCRL